MRIFIALKTSPYEEELYKILGEVKSKIKDNVKWVSKDNLHVTTKFLGEVEVPFLQKVEQITKSVSIEFSNFAFKIKGISGFPQKKFARVLFFSIEDSTNYISNVMKLLDEKFEEFGFKREESYVPHITFGRAKNSFVDLTSVEIKEFQIQVVALGLTIFESILKPEGPTYVELATFNFKDKDV